MSPQQARNIVWWSTRTLTTIKHKQLRQTIEALADELEKALAKIKTLTQTNH